MKSKELDVLRRSVSVIVGAQEKLRDDIEDLQAEVAAAQIKEASAKVGPFPPNFMERKFITTLRNALCEIDVSRADRKVVNLSPVYNSLSDMIEKADFYSHEAQNVGNHKGQRMCNRFARAARAIRDLAEEKS